MTNSELNENSRTSIHRGSRSFSFASLFFSRQVFEDVAHLYSWCRFCDDIADGSTLGFHQNPAGLSEDRVAKLVENSKLAVEGTSDPSDLPLIAFGQVMRKYQIPFVYAEDLLKGLQHDAAGNKIETLEELLLYCYRVAGTVGLMMCHIMGLKDQNSLEKAVHLGIALQLTNISRDIGDDFRVSKIYLPSTWLNELGVPPEDLLDPKLSTSVESLVARLLKESEAYYASGLTGLKDLPWRCALAVAIAASVYRRIGRTVLLRGYRAWENCTSESNSSRVILGRWDRAVALFEGFYLFSKTLPSRIFFYKRITPIERIWRYS